MHATYEILPEFLCHASEEVLFTHVISHDLRFKRDLTGLTFLATEEALKTDLSDTSMLVVPPSVQVANLMERVRVVCTRSTCSTLLVLPTSYNDRHSLYGYESCGTFYTDTNCVSDEHIMSVGGYVAL